MASGPNIYLLHGTDEYAIATRIKEFADRFPDATTAGMNLTRFEARSGSEDELLTAVNAMPFLAAERLVVLASPSARYAHPSARKKFLEFLDQVPPTTRLVLTEGETLKDNHWLMKWVRSNEGRAKDEGFFQPRLRDMPGWIINHCKKLGGKISPQAASRLAEMVGEDTRQAAQELVKLLTYVDHSRTIEIEDVEQVAIVSSQGDIFAMVDAMAVGDGRLAQKMLHRLLEEDDPLRLFGMVVRQFRILLIARETIDAGGGQQEVVKALGMHPFVGGKAYTQALKFDLPTLEAIFRGLLAIDEKVKTGQVAMDLALDMLTVQLSQR